jgi:hypothetical protein
MATAAVPATSTATTLDVLKTVAVVLMIADHVGLYVLDSSWLRVAGRPVAVIFGFLIGFSATTRVPPSWIGLGIGLTLLNRWLFPNDEPHTLDILLTLALTRMAIPFFDRLHRAHPLLLVPMVAVLGVLTEPVNAFLEYGTEVPIVALLGTAVRLDRGRPGEEAARKATALAALVAIGLVALRHFEFEPAEATACMAVLAATMLALASFRITPVALPPPIAPAVRWAGRNTLMIYAVHLAAFQLAAWAMLPEMVETDDDNDE